METACCARGSAKACEIDGCFLSHDQREWMLLERLMTYDE